MSQPITMDRAGRIVLPKDVRQRLNLGPGARLMLDVVAQRIELTPQPQADAAFAPAPSQRMVLRSTGKAFDAAAATRAEREAQSRSGKPR